MLYTTTAQTPALSLIPKGSQQTGTVCGRVLPIHQGVAGMTVEETFPMLLSSAQVLQYRTNMAANNNVYLEVPGYIDPI